MVAREDTLMTTALDNVDFLTRSEHRVTVLEALADEPHQYTELKDLTGVSRVTLNRLLAQFEEKRWIVETEQYEITPVGEIVASDLLTLLETTKVAQELQDVIRWLPTAAMDFDLRRLGDARIATVTSNEPHKPVERAYALCEPASQTRYIGNGTSVSFARMAADKIPSGDDRFAVVLPPSAIDTIAESPKSAPLHREMIEHGWDIYEHDTTLPISMGVYDGTVLLLLVDTNGTEQGFVESDDPVVRTWAEDTFDQYRKESTAVSSDVFET
jgi:predicted transcriptional regulator